MGGSSSSQAFNYDKQLMEDVATKYSIEVDEKGNLVEPTSKESFIVDGANARRRVGMEKGLVSVPFPEENEGKGYKTVWEVFNRGTTKFPNNRCLGTRAFTLNEEKKLAMNSDKTPTRGAYVWNSYLEVDAEAKNIGAGLIKLGYKSQENVGIFAPNRSEWVVAELALYVQNMRVVALYSTLGEEAVEYITNHAEIRCVFVSKENLGHLLKVAKKCPQLKHIIQFDVDERINNIHEAVDEESKKKAEENNITLLGWSEVKQLGASDSEIFPNPAGPEDLAYIMYTSGTTGNPKGAMLSHKNIVATIASVPYIFPLKGDDRHLSYLPLAHIFETVVQAAFWLSGAQIGFFQNNIKRLSEDLVELKPTFLAGVPRVFGRIYQTVFNGVADRNFIVRYVFNKKYADQCDRVRKGLPRNIGADTKIFIPLRTRVGLEHCKYILTGAAPCPPYLLEFLKVAIGATVFQGYGLTETAASLAVTSAEDRNVGHVGPPVVCAEVKLMPIEDMNYLPSDKPCPRGEVWARGDNMFSGYFKDEKSTSETIHPGGWVATGDVGRWNPNGTLSIIDRKKNMFKLSQGEYVAAEKVEQEYAKSGLVAQIWVYGNSFKSFLLAVVVPNADLLAAHCRAQGWWAGSADSKLGSDTFNEEYTKTLTGSHSKEIKKYIHEQLKLQEKPLKGFEKVMDIIVVTEIDKMGMGFNEANQCLTPTFKLKRPQLLQKYIKQLKDTYAANNEPVAADEKWPGEV